MDTGAARCSYTSTSADLFTAAVSDFASLPVAVDYTQDSNAEYYPGLFPSTFIPGVTGPTSLTTVTPLFDVAGSDLTPPFVSIVFNYAKPSMQEAFFTYNVPRNKSSIPASPFVFTLSKNTTFNNQQRFAPLRHRFLFNPDNVPLGVAEGSLLLVERSRTSRNGGNACAMPVELVDVHRDLLNNSPTVPLKYWWAPGSPNAFDSRNLSCRAIVLRSDGAGFCYTTDGNLSARQYSRYMWRKLFRKTHTSGKCLTEPCNRDLFLPE